MQIESHAKPLQATPQLRYAALHRSLERGLASDEVWSELAEVCALLGHREEAVRCAAKVANAATRRTLEYKLARRGIGEFPAGSEATRPSPDDRCEAPPPDHDQDEEPAQPRLRDHLQDAAQFLLLQHMPAVALAATLSFPLLVGLGGFLTGGSSMLLLAGVAALPGLMLLAVVGAMGRRILRGSFAGSNDVPALGDLRGLARDARAFVGDAALVIGSFLAPPAVAIALEAPASSTVPSLVIGLLFAPMAWALRSLRGDYASLSPVVVLRASARMPLQYLALAATCWALLLPAALAVVLVAGRPVWAQIAVVGPLVALPFFLASRLIGTWFETRRRQFGLLLAPSREAASVPAPVADAVPAPTAARPVAAKAPAAPAPAPAPSAANRRPAASSPAATRQPAAPRAAAPASSPGVASPAAARPAAARPGAARPAGQPAPRAATPARPASASAGHPAPARPAAAAPPARRPAGPARPAAPAPAAQIEGRAPQPGLDDKPDLSGMPGAMVVKGRERQRRGAAARSR